MSFENLIFSSRFPMPSRLHITGITILTSLLLSPVAHASKYEEDASQAISLAVRALRVQNEQRESTDQYLKALPLYNIKSLSYPVTWGFSVGKPITEPTIFFEFAYRTAKLAHRSSILNTFVTNGYMTEDAVKKISKYLDAATVDFKASGDSEFYSKFMSVPDVNPIFASLKQMKKQRIFLEVTNLIIPQVGDDIEQCRKLAEWINTEIGSEVPFHILQFFPSHQLTELPLTPVSTLEKCIDEAKKAGLRYVYIGNVPGHNAENTYCYNCREPLITRSGTNVKNINLFKDRCPNCGLKINILTD